jgi:phosphate transport system protein
MEHRPLHSHLDAIRQRVLAMAGEVERMIADATHAILQRDDGLAQATLARDRIVDRLEMEIDEACHSVLARKQPTACDMRFLVAVMKITADLERMGDSAVNIVQAARRLNGQPKLDTGFDLARMSALVQAMLRHTLDSFVERDAVAAAAVCAADDAVDAAYQAAFGELVELMSAQPDTATRAVHLLLVARNLERIADHATNIAEDVIYYVDARDVRHSASAPRLGAQA